MLLREEVGKGKGRGRMRHREGEAAREVRPLSSFRNVIVLAAGKK